MKIPMPFKNKTELDLEYIKNVIRNAYGFKDLQKYL